MLPWGLSCLSVLGAVGTALLGAGLLLSLAQHLWTLRWTLSRDRASALPLPWASGPQACPGEAAQGSVERMWDQAGCWGLVVCGCSLETLHWP